VRKWRSCVALVVGAAVSLALSSATIGPASGVEWLIVGQTFLATGLDPAEGSAGWALVSHGVAENLFTVDRLGQIVPSLAKSLQRESDGSWRGHLADGRRFSDGSLVTAFEVAHGLNRTSERNGAAT